MASTYTTSYDYLIGDARRREQAASTQAAGSRNRFESAIMGFDPQAFLRQSAGAAFSSLSEQFAQRAAQRRAGLNARGLLRSPIGEAEAGQDFNERLARALSGLSMQAAGLEQNRIGQLGGLFRTDLGQQNTFYDAATGLAQSQLQQEAMEAASRRAMWGNIFGGGLGAVGDIFGGFLGGRGGGGTQVVATGPHTPIDYNSFRPRGY